MSNKKTIKKILIGLVIAIVLLGIYAILAPKEESSNANMSLSTLLDSGSTMGQIEETDTDVANAEILKVLRNIQFIQLDDDIFTNPVFKQLKDSNFTIPKPIRIGRPNPFLPIGFDIILEESGDDEEELDEPIDDDELDDFFDDDFLEGEFDI